MELIKETGSKSWINKSGKKDSKKFGIFLCPNCKKEVEKPLRQGTSAFSCGNKSCRKEMFNANPNNPGNKNIVKLRMNLQTQIKNYLKTILNGFRCLDILNMKIKMKMEKDIYML